MKSGIEKQRLPTLKRRTLPVIERLESRTLMSAGASPAASAAAARAKATFPVSDVLGAAAGFPIWQNGQPLLPGSPAPSNGSTIASASTAPPLSGTGNGTLLGSASVAGGPGIFSVLPVLPPDGLAVALLRMLYPSQTHNTR